MSATQPPPPQVPPPAHSAVATASNGGGLLRWVSGTRGALLASVAAAFAAGWWLQHGGPPEAERQPGSDRWRVGTAVPYTAQPASPREVSATAKEAPAAPVAVPPAPPPPPPPYTVPAEALKATARIASVRHRGGDAPGRERPAGVDPSDPNSALAQRLRATRMDTRQAAQVPDPAWMIRPGTTIPCTLDTAIDSTLEGQMVCTVARNVMCSTGWNQCLDRDTTIIGEIKADMRPGQERLFITAALAITPDHVTIDLDSAVTDALGRSGVDGEVNNRRGERLASALAIGLSGTGSALASSALSGAGVPGNAASTAGSTLGNTFRRELNVPPTLRKHQGEIVHVNVSRWLNFGAAYEARMAR